MPRAAIDQRRDPLIEQTWANEFAKEWIDAWNSHDLDRILFSIYVDDFEMSSPLIIERRRTLSVFLRGKTAIRDYWAGARGSSAINSKLIDVTWGEPIGICIECVGSARKTPAGSSSAQ